MRIEITAETDPYNADYVTLSCRVVVCGEELAGVRKAIHTNDLMHESVFEILWAEVGATLRDELKRHRKGGK